MHPHALEAGKLTLLFGGYGEERGALTRGVEYYGALGIAAIAPVLQFDDRRHFDHMSTEVPLAVAAAYNEEAGLPAETPFDGIGKSLGGAVLIRAASFAPERCDVLALHSPIGLTNESFGNSPGQRRDVFVPRLTVYNRMLLDQNPWLDPGNNTALAEGEKRAKKDIKRGVADAKVDYVLGLDLGPDLRDLVKSGHSVGVFAGVSDPVIRLTEYRKALESLGLRDRLVEMPGSHALMGNRACRRQQEVIARWLHSLRSGQEAA
jgi:hypothetical protein